jgi:catechol 2,3-dioxygenase-like lactoylglutathione lyase family enzyme
MTRSRSAFHISLNVSDLVSTVDFYEVLFGVPPAKRHADYAKFEVDDPPLVLSLEPARRVAGTTLNHLGLRVTTAGSLVEVQRRLEEHGFGTKRENGVQCCYAKQTKFWVRDPDGRRWEVYVLEEDLDHRGAGTPRPVLVGSVAARIRYLARCGLSALWRRVRGVTTASTAAPDSRA